MTIDNDHLQNIESIIKKHSFEKPSLYVEWMDCRTAEFQQCQAHSLPNSFLHRKREAFYWIRGHMLDTAARGEMGDTHPPFISF